MKIEKNVPFPAKAVSTAKWVSMWEEMDEGDSIYFAPEDIAYVKTKYPHRACFNQTPGFRPLYRKLTCGGLRVWKVAKDSK